MVLVYSFRLPTLDSSAAVPGSDATRSARRQAQGTITHPAQGTPLGHAELAILLCGAPAWYLRCEPKTGPPTRCMRVTALPGMSPTGDVLEDPGVVGGAEGSRAPEPGAASARVRAASA